MDDIALALAGIDKYYGQSAAVQGLDLAIRKGEFVSLLGPSGCGKSTTLMMIAGFEQPSAGEIRVAGRRIDHLAPDQRNIGVVFQSYALFPHMSVARNVEYGLKLRQVPPAERRARVQAMLDIVNMAHLAERMPAQLSGGQQQRVALARALVIEPDILLLDEPFSALDRQLRERLQIEVREVQQKLGITTIFVTHDQEEALLMSDRVAVMEGGRIEQCGSPQEIYRWPATEVVARFIGRGNFLRGRVVSSGEGTRFEPQGGANEPLPLPPGYTDIRGAATAFFRPEDVRAAQPEDGRPVLPLPGTVRAVYFQGAASTVELSVQGMAEPVLADAGVWLREPPLQPGDAVQACVDVGRLQVFPA